MDDSPKSALRSGRPPTITSVGNRPSRGSSPTSSDAGGIALGGIAPGGIAPGGAPGGRFGRVFAVVAAGVAMSNLDLFVVNVALPDIGRHFDGSSLSSLSWVLNGYAVVFAALLVPAGNLADRTSPRRAYLWGTAIFVVASALCAAAPTVWFLVAARVLQAAGAAVMTPSSLGLLLAAAPPERRGAAVRAWTAVSGLAAALGPVAGGLLTELDWRWVFLVNLPVGLAVLVAGPRVLPHPPRRPGVGRSDPAGAVLLTVGIAALALGLVRGPDWGWGSARVVGSLLASVLLLAGFLHRSARHPAPVLPLPLLRVRTFSAAAVAAFVFSVAFAAMLLSGVLWCQDVWHWSALRTGLAIAPGPLMVPGLALAAGPLVARLGSGRVAAAGCLVFAAGIGWWILRMAPQPDYVGAMLPGMLLTGVGVGLILPTLISAAVTALPPASVSTGSAVVTMARQIGTVIGTALLVAALGGAAADDLGSLTDAYDLGWIITVSAVVLAALACLTIPRPTTTQAPPSPRVPTPAQVPTVAP
ncbi:drug resistance transporter, EmrB/QacA subfamily [Frankia torreyi]|uniref:Drug resistance transporter, EmrB/QacA subfamily n=1 Tax=Frankia torreyi TaxID=1856 RepID=A0A0D8BH60_9ACTN|nr:MULTISPECIES: MFS transporter [Frankia]KJE22752.1 drug resistance transporter, EmrB/QacA subfamily [Frankia torreyi]KQM04701.1 drug resistance transporter, EmrB/QacA subfamily [Frankia sp. CpI1-P]